MPKTSDKLVKRAARAAPTPPIKFDDLPLQVRRKKLRAFFDDSEAAWTGKPDVDAVAVLAKMRRGS